MRFGAACAAAVGVLGLAPASWACGGFFCAQVPVDQSSEDIFFEVDPAQGRVRAIITIQYEGDAESFSWILPVSSVPEVSFSTDLVFRQLRAPTDVAFNVTTTRWNCAPTGGGGKAGDASGSMDASSSADEFGDGWGGGPSGVQVLAAGQTGPYDYVVLDAPDATVLTDWLSLNEFDVTPGSIPIIESYLAQGMVFVAVKLLKSASTGDISPIVLEMEEPEPCVPIVLTQIAAQPDMPIRIWIAGDGRAVPKNWFHVEPNWMRLNWQSPATSGTNGTSSYPELVGRAVDEAAGHGFVTEYAGPVSPATGGLSTAANAMRSALSNATSAYDFIVAATTALGVATPGIISMLEQATPIPANTRAEGVAPADFYSQWWLYEADYARIPFDATAAMAVAEERIIEPLEVAAEWMGGHSHLTRIYTQLSPHEMTRDPLFAFSPLWPEVSNMRTARILEDCMGTTAVVRRIVELPDGATYLFPESGTIPRWMDELPWATSVSLDIPGEGAFEVRPEDVPFVDSQLGIVSAALAVEGLTPPSPFAVPSEAAVTPSGQYDGPGSPSPLPEKSEASGGGCRLGGGMGNAPLSRLPLLAAALALLGLRSSRRRR